MDTREEPQFIVIPPAKLSKETFEALLEEFILREGTDYGAVELSLETKRNRVLKQLETGQIKIVYSPESENCSILNSTELGKLKDFQL